LAHYNEDCIHQLCVITHHKNYVVFADDTSFFIFTLDRSVAEAVDVDYYVRILCNPTGISKGKGVFASYIIYLMSNTILVRNIYIIFYYDMNAFVLYRFS